MRDNEKMYNDIVELFDSYVDKVIDEDFNGNGEYLSDEQEYNIFKCFMEVLMVKMHVVYDDEIVEEMYDDIRASINTELLN